MLKSNIRHKKQKYEIADYKGLKSIVPKKALRIAINASQRAEELGVDEDLTESEE